MEIIVKISQFVLSLSILVVAHELGHFFFAKLFKTRVEKFYLFFDPWFSLFKFKKGDTEYGVGWLPLGGYVKISGMIDESMDTEQMSLPPEPWEFRAKPSWQRLLIMLGGVLVNFLLALFIYSMILFTWGEEYFPVQNADYGYQYCKTALKNGFQNGDKIISVDNISYETLADVSSKVLFENAKKLQVQRDGRILTIDIPNNFTQQFLDADEKIFASIRFPFVVDKVMQGQPAAKAGLQPNDRFLAVNGVATPSVYEFQEEMSHLKSETATFTILRNRQEQNVDIKVSDDGKIGVSSLHPAKILSSKTIKYGFVESIPAGIQYGVDRLTSYVKSLKILKTKEGLSSLSGPIGIANIFPNTWNWEFFWNMTALLSLVLAFMNMLPIPALDGGHVLFILYEMISGRKPGEKFMEYAQFTGMLLLLALILFATGNDIIRIFK